MSDRAQQIDYAAEVMLDFLTAAADGKDDDDLVFIDSPIRALADACGIDWTEDVPPMTAREVRDRVRWAKADLAGGSRGC